MLPIRLLNKFIPSLLGAVLLSGIFFNIAQAHSPSRDGSISAVLHISPDDHPLVGEPATLFFDFRDEDGKFKGSDCDCQVRIIKDEEVMFAAQLFTDSAYTQRSSPTVTYAFPYAAVYKIEVNGQPKTPGAFQAFKLSYEDRVEPALSSGSKHLETHNELHTWHYIIFGAGFIVIILYYIKERRKLSRQRAQAGDTKNNN